MCREKTSDGLGARSPARIVPYPIYTNPTWTSHVRVWNQMSTKTEEIQPTYTTDGGGGLSEGRKGSHIHMYTHGCT